jgi:hypothetical protein
MVGSLKKKNSREVHMACGQGQHTGDGEPGAAFRRISYAPFNFPALELENDSTLTSN